MGKRGLEPGAPDFDPKSLEGADSDAGFLGTPRVVNPESVPGVIMLIAAVIGVVAIALA